MEKMIAFIYIICFIFWLFIGFGIAKICDSPTEKKRDIRISIKGKDDP